MAVFFWREQDDVLDRGFTQRRGGVSHGPFEGLNLGGHVGDSADHVVANRAALAASLSIDPDRLLFMDQCHGSGVTVAEGPWSGGSPPAADALVTAAPGLALAVLVADCARSCSPIASAAWWPRCTPGAPEWSPAWSRPP